MTRDEILALRKQLLMGNPPYEIEPVFGKKTRKEGAAGIEELRQVGEYHPAAPAGLLALETCLRIIEHLLEKEEGE
jgi:hypothetical protein